MNYLMEAENKHKWKVLIKRVVKQTLFKGQLKDCVMWGLFALEEIPAGAYVLEYTGEVLTKKEGDKRGALYDRKGLNYLFDMNDPDE